MAKVLFNSVKKNYGDVEVVKSLDLVLEDGSLTVLVGPSGCGKTTTLRMLAGLEDVSSGTILIGDRDVTVAEPNKRQIAMVFQNYALYPHLSVRDNIAFPLKARKVPKEKIKQKVELTASSMGLEQYLARRPKDLSGGQQQRVAIARAMVRDAEVFLFDEPLSNLDAKLRAEMRTEILRIQRDVGTTSLYVTHDQEEAMTLSDNMVVMNNGKIEQMGHPTDVYQKPVNTFVASFIGTPKMNLFTGHYSDGRVHIDGTGVSIRADGAQLDGKLYKFGIRPEELKIEPVSVERVRSDDDGSIRIELLEHLGPRSIVTMKSLNAKVTLQSVVADESAYQLKSMDAVKLSAAAANIHVFDLESGERVEK